MRRMSKPTAANDRLTHLGACMSRVANQRDKEAFAELFDHYAPQIRAYSLAREPGADLVADELVQEVMMRVWLKASKGENPTSCQEELKVDSFRIRRLFAHWVEEGALQPT